MTSSKKRIAVLSSSRADYGTYKPLLSKLHEEKEFEIELIVFGTHVSPLFGSTISEIEEDGYTIGHIVDNMLLGNSPSAIADCIGLTHVKFSSIWKTNSYDLIICLGDRFEMFAAVSSSVPFGIKVAHLFGGEVTEGAIDNIYRHSISLMSRFHFVSTSIYADRLQKLLDEPINIYNVGALHFDNLKDKRLYSNMEFKTKFNIDLNKPSILVTFHPETVSYHKNDEYAKELMFALNVLKDKYQIVITMPNADTSSDIIRDQITEFEKGHSGVICIESFGLKGYLTCMKECEFLLGNTSSGFVEASFFPKRVINIGDRQKGRLRTPNIIDCEIDSKHILEAVNNIEETSIPIFNNPYGNGNVAGKIVKILRDII